MRFFMLGEFIMILKKIKRRAIADRIAEERLYEQALREIESGVRRDGLWAKAFQKSHGDNQRAKALYVEYRVRSIKDEAEISAALNEQHIEKRTEKDVKPSLPNIEKDKQNPIKSENINRKQSCLNDCFGGYRKSGCCTVCGKPIPERLDKTAEYAKPLEDNSGCFGKFFIGLAIISGALVLPIIILIFALSIFE